MTHLIFSGPNAAAYVMKNHLEALGLESDVDHYYCDGNHDSLQTKVVVKLFIYCRGSIEDIL